MVVRMMRSTAASRLSSWAMGERSAYIPPPRMAAKASASAVAIAQSVGTRVGSPLPTYLGGGEEVRGGERR